jgi:hypothetical protein
MVIGITGIGIIATTVVVAEIVAEIGGREERAEIAEPAAAVRTVGRVAEIGGREEQVGIGDPEGQAEAADKRHQKNKRIEIIRK